jgi:hypothetical protein
VPEKFSVPKFSPPIRARCHASTDAVARSTGRIRDGVYRPLEVLSSHGDRGGKVPLLHCARRTRSEDQIPFRHLKSAAKG